MEDNKGIGLLELLTIIVWLIVITLSLKEIRNQNNIIIKHWEYQNGVRIEKNDNTYQYIPVEKIAY